MGQKISSPSSGISKGPDAHVTASEGSALKIVKQAQSLKTLKSKLKSFSKPWSVVIKSDIETWKNISSNYGFQDVIYGCTNKECDRDSICLKKAKVILHKSSNEIEIQRYGSQPSFISYSDNAPLCQKFSLGYNINEVVGAEKDNLMLVVIFRWERLQYESAFLLIDVKTSKISCIYESPATNMSIMECKISPDGQKVAVLFYQRPDSNSPFRYDLYIIDVCTSSVFDVLTCNTEVRPYVVFDPRFQYSRIAVVNYSNDSDLRGGLVSYCLNSKQVVTVSHVMLSIIYGGGFFCATFSRDGHFLILQRITASGNGCYADMYVFDPDNLKLLKHYYTKLKQHSTICSANYTPNFSICGSRMCILSEEHINDARKLYISVHQLPRPISLKKQCRISILQRLQSFDDIYQLPLPKRIMTFLKFSPEL